MMTIGCVASLLSVWVAPSMDSKMLSIPDPEPAMETDNLRNLAQGATVCTNPLVISHLDYCCASVLTFKNSIALHYYLSAFVSEIPSDDCFLRLLSRHRNLES